MTLPVDPAGFEDVPLEALPSESSSSFRETAASIGTGSGDADAVSEPQSTEENTANVNPEAPAISLNHAQHSPVRRLTTKKAELVIIIVGTCIALAALILQIRANGFSKESKELTEKGNAVAENAYKLQLWDDCHDRQDLHNSSLCQSASNLISRDVFFGKLQHIYGGAKKNVYSSVYMTFDVCACIVSFLMLCYGFCTLALDELFWLIMTERLEKYLAEDRSPMYNRSLYLVVVPLIFVTFLSSLSLEPEGCKAFDNVIVILIGLCFVVEKLIQRLRKDAPALQDEEAQGHQMMKLPHLPTLPASGGETSFMYTKLKRRLRTYKYQQDD